MPIMNTVIKGGGTTPTGTKSITANGVYDVTDFASADVQVPTTAPAHYLTFGIDNNGQLVSGLGATSVIDLTGCTTIGSAYLLNEAYKDNTLITGIVNMSDVQIIGTGRNACFQMFYGCTGITGFDLSSLTTINSLGGLDSAFYGCTGIISASFPSLTTINANSACGSMFRNCTGLTSADLSGLTTISGSVACGNMFQDCTSLATVYIGGTTAINFGTYTNQFLNMFIGCTQNIDVYAPAANQTQIEAFSGYPNFGATGTVTWHWRS